MWHGHGTVDRCSSSGSAGAEIDAVVRRRDDEPVIAKYQINALQNTDLKRIAR
jgi:hypothetical protein